MSNDATYSKIIGPDEYCQIMTEQHLHIADSDQRVIRAIRSRLTPETRATILELGCGPGRLLEQVQARLNDFPNVSLIGFDYDQVFLERARRIADDTRTRIIQSDLENLHLSQEEVVPIIYSQGVHHHIPKGDSLNRYLERVHQILTPDGVYVLSDEFLPEYHDASERLIKAVIWYSYIINDAQQKSYDYLAQEEAKTLIDDLNEGVNPDLIKTEDQIQLVLKKVGSISMAALQRQSEEAEKLALELLLELKRLKNYNPTGDQTIDLSRGDFKISPSVFKQEVESAGFEVESEGHSGPIESIGGMRIYTLKKAN